MTDDVDADKTAPSVTEAVRAATADISQPVRDVGLIVGVLFGVYALFAVFVFNQGLNSVVSTLRVVTFFIAVYAMLALALNLQWGYTGLFNIGVAGFMAVGVYTMGILAGDPAGSPPGLGLPLPFAIVAGMAAAAFVGLLTALPALRLRADYLAIVTLGISEIIRLTLNSGALNSWLIETVGIGTGAGSGMGLPSFSARGLFYVDGSTANQTALAEVVFAVTGPLGIRESVVIAWAYVFVLIVFVVGFYVLLARIGNSPFGRVLKSIREDELVASSLGKHTQLFKIKVFMLGCALMGLAGILWQGSQGFVSPNSFMPIVTFYVFVALIIGGSGSNTGSVVGAIVFVGLLFEGPRRAGSALSDALAFTANPNTSWEALTLVVSGEPLALFAYATDNISALQFVLLGVVLIVLMQKRPEGLLGHRNETAAAVPLTEQTRSIRGGESDEQ